MSEVYQSLSHSKWDCKYHVVFVAKRRRKAIFDQTRRQLGAIFHSLARQKECRIIEGHPSHARPRTYVYRDSAEAPGGFGDWVSERQERYRNCPVIRKRRGTFLENTSGLAAAPCQPSVSNWSRYANTSANRTSRMEIAGNSNV